MQEIIHDILATLAYFDLFDFPLTEAELYSYLRHSPGKFTYPPALKRLVAEELVFRVDGYYLLRREPLLVRRRKEGERKATELLRIAARISRWLAFFPFVRAVAVSGSLSKKFADADSDIDFFIITAPGRLWIARTVLHLFKKLAFLARREDYFCMNYFVDEAEPEISDKNIYTAIEVATLLPMAGDKAMRDFFQANRWSATFLPNRKSPGGGLPVKSKCQKTMEKAIDLCGGNRLEAWLMQTTEARWSKKTAAAKKTSKGHVLEMTVTEHCSRPAASGFHDALMKRYEERLRLLFSCQDKIATG